MAADNTLLNAGIGGDTMRDLARAAGTVKTQVVQLDLGGASANSEVLITAGQQAMAASVPVAFASNQTPLQTLSTPASNNWTQSLAVTAGATATIVNIASSVAGYQIKGFIAHGTGDGYFVVQIAGVTILSGRTRATMPTLMITLPNGIAVTTGSNISLNVSIESGSTADYESTLLGA